TSIVSAPGISRQPRRCSTCADSALENLVNPTATSSLAAVNAAALPEYTPTTYLDFNKPENKSAFEQALAEVRASYGTDYPLVIAGERMKGLSTFPSTNPARPSEILGKFQAASAEQANLAVDKAFATFKSWSNVKPAERAAYLIEAARRMR